MAEIQSNLQPSLLDRLIDEDPDSARDPQIPRKAQLVALRNAVRRDLEALLNSHCRCISPPEGADELQLSVVEYGVRDFLSAYAGASTFREEFRISLQDTIRRFEPRFISVSVTLRDGEVEDRTLRFRIDALMYAEPAPEPVIFDSTLDPSSQAFAVTSFADV